MRPPILKAYPASGKIQPYMEILNFRNEVIAMIWADGNFAPVLPVDFSIDEMNFFSILQKHFFTFYNNLIAKDKEIEELRQDVIEITKEMIWSINPIVDAYKN